MRRLRQHPQILEPSIINFYEAISEEESDHHSTPSSPQSHLNEEILETPPPKCLKDYSSPTPRGFSNAIIFPNEHTNGVFHANNVLLF